MQARATGERAVNGGPLHAGMAYGSGVWRVANITSPRDWRASHEPDRRGSPRTGLSATRRWPGRLPGLSAATTRLPTTRAGLPAAGLSAPSPAEPKSVGSVPALAGGHHRAQRIHVRRAAPAAQL